MSEVLLETKSICKEFPGVRALKGVDFKVHAGEIHSLCGENGAGKSTLMKILSGLYPYPSYSGEILMDGKLSRFSSTLDSTKSGIAIVYQELSLVPEMNVAENIFLGRESSIAGLVKLNAMRTAARELLARLGLAVSPESKIAELSIGERQLIEIAKALSQNPRVLILDEPTSALSQKETQTLIQILKKLRAQGLGIVLITHKLDEIFALSDRITVLRDGQGIGTWLVSETNQDKVITSMVGRELKDFYPKTQRTYGNILFEVRDLKVRHAKLPHRNVVDGVSWSVKKGEILGFAGLMGSGRTEMLMGIFGALRTTGQILIDGKALKMGSPAAAFRYGLSLASEDRKKYGLVLDYSVQKNITLSGLNKVSQWGVLSPSMESHISGQYVEKMGIKIPSLETPVKNLSGGNQQKVVLSKCLLNAPRVLFLDEPTRGIDIGAKAEIYNRIHQLAAEGLSIVMVSSELPELLGVCDRILVLCEGQITDELSRADATEEKIMRAATRFQSKIQKQHEAVL